MNSLIHPDYLNIWNNHVHSINDAKEPEIMDICLVSKDGKTIWISHLCSPVYDDKESQVGVRSTNLDITERYLYEEQHRKMALHDHLTDLPNRYAMIREIQRCIDGDRKQNIFTVFFLDLFRFKNINDHFGHSFGDLLLIEVSNRLLKIHDELYVSRFGGDEFAFLAPFIKNDREAKQIANKILLVLTEPFYIDNLELFVTGRIGVSFYPRDAVIAEKLLSSAELAKRKAEIGENIAGLDTTGLSEQIEHFIFTENNLYKALINNEFEVFYQPKINVSSNQIQGLEALIRWNHPKRGMIMPGEFIQVAEETGQIINIGSFIIDRCLSDMEQWGKENYHMPVSINISARQFSNQNHCEECLRKIKQSAIDNQLIELEVTEQVFLSNIEHSIERLEMFRDVGVSIALDDFGTCYSSLNYLKMLPIDTLKLDMSFIKDLATNKKSYTIIKAILQMSTELNLNTVAEGVETEQQKDLLKELNCEIIQGFLFYKPMPKQELDKILENN